MEVSIRQAKASDHQMLFEIYLEGISDIYNLPKQEAFELDRKYWGELPWFSIEKMKEALRDPNKIILIAEAEDKTVGFLYAFRTSPEELYINDIYVLQKYRRKGIGSKLVKELEKKAKEIGIKRIRAHVYEGSKEFFARLGYRLTGNKAIEGGILWQEVIKEIS